MLSPTPTVNTSPNSGDISLSSTKERSGGVTLALLFLVLLTPINLDVAGLALSPYKIFLLIMFWPWAARLISGYAGPVTWTGWLLLAFVVWTIVTLVYNNGIQRFPYASMVAAELFGGYMAGRILVRNISDYRRFIRYYLIALLFILPFAAYELFYSRMLVNDFLGSIFSVTRKNYEFRYGLSRVQFGFPHSILFGLFCSLALASTYYLYVHSFFKMLPRMALVIGTTLMSLSSGPMLSLVLQTVMIVWDILTRGSWKIFCGLTVFAYFFLETFSNRGAVVFLVETMTLNPMSGWWRIHIWRHGSLSVLNNPIWGIGLNDWVRPKFLSGSVDNFWLLMAMRHGFPGISLLLLALALHIFAIIRIKNLPDEAKNIRKAYMITLAGLLFTLTTVHIWGAVTVMVMFYIGAGSFLYANPMGVQDDDARKSDELSESSSRQPEPQSSDNIHQGRYSRFANKPRRFNRDHADGSQSRTISPKRKTHTR